jgi:hypothetical protein
MERADFEFLIFFVPFSRCILQVTNFPALQFQITFKLCPAMRKMVDITRGNVPDTLLLNRLISPLARKKVNIGRPK